MNVLIALLAATSIASASDLLGPIWDLQGKHIGDGEPLSWKIEYLDDWGRTIVDATGGHFYHDRCCGSFQTDDPSWIYPQKYWGTFPMYYIGTVMSYRITLRNTGVRTYENLRVVAIQEYLNPDGGAGERIGPGAAKDWLVPELRGGESVTLEGSFAIEGDAHGGLDQTHLQVQHWDDGKGKTGAGAVIIDDTAAAIWCPPDVPGAPQTAAATGSVRVTGGARGYFEPAGGKAATIEVLTRDAGSITVRIYSQAGSLVRELSEYTGGARTETLTWDGTDSFGLRVLPGVYLAVVEGPGLKAKEKLAVVR